MEIGTPVWVLAEDRVWRRAVVHATTPTSLGCRLTDAIDEASRVLAFPASAVGSKVFVCNPIEQRELGVEDLTALVHLHEPAILHTLKVRFMKQKIYTSTGSILVAVNPFQALSLYDEPIKARYIAHGSRAANGEKLAPLPPHVYAVSDKAFRDMNMPTDATCNQSILVSGESGAGKTETTKIIMNYLASVSSATTNDTHIPERENVRNRVLESNPILEAFGNARTNRNNNSSRFGKFIRLGFAKDGSLLGASISTYLLERVRLVSQSIGERNYHIFYELLRGATPDELAALRLTRIEDYKYLNSSQCYDRRDGVDDGDQYAKTRHAMTTIGMADDEQWSVLELVAAVLHLGNVELVKKGGEESQCSDGSAPLLSTLATLLGIDASIIEKGLTTKKIKVGGEVITKGLTVLEAATSRDAVAKTIYARVFDWLVDRINQSISYDASASVQSAHSRFIGVVDIFGFEIFATNSLEQLCINFANEKLQQLFAKYVFEMEQKEYAAEAIPWTFVEYPNNDACVAMFEARPIGLFSLLDEQCVIPRGNDAALAAKYYDVFASHAHLSSTKLQRGQAQFTIAHYAGDVVYTATGFIEKNKDSVHVEALELLGTSSKAFVTHLFAGDGSLRRSTALSLKADSPPRRSTNAASSVVLKFKSELSTLLELLHATVPHFIRCIKPNDELDPHAFDDVRVVEQLRCSGVLEAVKISRSGYPVRMLHSTFLQHYRCLSPSAAMSLELLLLTLLPTPNAFRVGLTKVFLLQGAYEDLNRCKIRVQASAVLCLQRYARGLLARTRYHRQVAAIRTLQRAVRRRRALQHARRRQRQSRGSVCIQAHWRGYRARSVHQCRVRAVRLLQRMWRGYRGRVSAAQMRRQLQAEAIIERALLKQKADEEANRLKKAREMEIKAAALIPLGTDPAFSAKMGPLLPALGRPLLQTPVVFEEFSSSDEEDEGGVAKNGRRSSSTASTQESKSTTSENEYEINWECGMLGLYFESDEVSGLPVVRRVHETLSTCADIFDVSPGDILLSVGGKRVHNNDIRHILRLLQDIDKPVALRFQRTTNSETVREPSLMSDEYEVLWRDNVPLGLGFKPDKKKEMPSVSKCRGNPQIPGMFNVRLGDYLTAINEISTYRVEFARVIKLLEDGPRPVVLRFMRADLDDALLESSRASEASTRESSFRFSRMSTMSLNPKRDDSLYNITWKEEDGALGLVVKQALSSFYPEVTKVKPEGAILRQPNKVQIGDLLISINNNNISKMGFRNAMHLLQIGPKPVLLTFQKQGRASHVGVPASI